MKKLFFILTFLFFLSFNVWAADCSDITFEPEITVSYSFGNLTYDKSKSISEITILSRKINQNESSSFAEGLSTVDVTFRVAATTTIQPVGINKFCVIPSKIDIFIGLSNPTIYLANSLVEGSCKYNIVLRHEQTHQQINKTTLEYYLPIFKAAVTNIIKKSPAIMINETNQIEPVTKDLTEIYNKTLLPLVDFIKKEISKEQLKLDNQTNYKYEYNLCKE